MRALHSLTRAARSGVMRADGGAEVAGWIRDYGCVPRAPERLPGREIPEGGTSRNRGAGRVTHSAGVCRCAGA